MVLLAFFLHATNWLEAVGTVEAGAFPTFQSPVTCSLIKI